MKRKKTPRKMEKLKREKWWSKCFLVKGVRYYILIGFTVYTSACVVNKLNISINCQNFGVSSYCEISSGFGDAAGSLATTAYQQNFVSLNYNLAVGTSGTIS
jgi:hypothetical protein